MRMRWVDLLFAHWRVPAATIQPLLPGGLELETFDGSAWLGIVPFRMEDVAPRFLPAIPGLSAFPEINVRTYVRHGSRAGVWFLSLDAARRPAVEGARLGFHLPYFRARMSVETEAGWVEYRSDRDDARGAAAAFAARYHPIGPVQPARSGSLAAFLTDRRGLFAADASGRLSWTAIRHDRWPLQLADAEIQGNTMASAHGIALPDEQPVLYFSKRLDVVAWWPRRLT